MKHIDFYLDFISPYAHLAFEQLPRAWQPLFVLAVFALQVVYSRWWLARYRFGPMEWLWRGMTYGRLPPMRVGPA